MKLERSTKFGRLFSGLIIVVILYSVKIQASFLYWTDFEYTGFDNMHCSLMETNIRVNRVNKTNYAYSGTMEIKSELSNDWEAEFVILYSAKGNNQFIKLPYKLPKDGLCNFFDGAYTQYGAAKKLASVSDLPEAQKNVSLCALYRKGIYTVSNLTFSRAVMIKFLQPGYYKAQLIFSRKNSNESGLLSINLRFY